MVAVAVVDVKSESLYVQNGTVSELVTGLLMFWGVGIAFPGKCNHKAQSAYMATSRKVSLARWGPDVADSQRLRVSSRHY
jgi:hypothetical protein